MKKKFLLLGILFQSLCSHAANVPNDAIYVWTSPTTYDCYLISGTPTITYEGNELVITVDGTEAKRINLSSVDNVEVTYGIKNPLVTLNEFGMATFSFNADLQLTSGIVKAYTAKVDGVLLNCTEIADGIIPAGNGVFLYGQPSASVQFVAYENGPAPALSNNDLIATTMADGSLAKVPTTGRNYKLNGILFQQFTDRIINPYEAFVNVSNASANAAKYNIIFDEEGTTTGIVEFEKSSTTTYYDLQGRKVEHPTTGVYIINGKKTVIK